MSAPYRELAHATGALEVPIAGVRGLLARLACWLLVLCGAKLAHRGVPAAPVPPPPGARPAPVFPTCSEVVSCHAVAGKITIVVAEVQRYGDRKTGEQELRRAEILLEQGAGVAEALRNQIERYDESEYDLPIFVVDPSSTSLRLTREQAAEAAETIEQLLAAANTRAKPS